MQIYTNKKKGFSMLEVILAISIMAILVGLATTYYSNSQVRADVNSQAANIVHYLRLAQSNAASGLNNTNHGLHFETSSYTIFEGESYDNDSPKNVKIDLPSTMTIDGINLDGGGGNVIFLKSTGETDNFGTITVNSAAINKTVTITINYVGTINY